MLISELLTIGACRVRMSQPPAQRCSLKWAVPAASAVRASIGTVSAPSWQSLKQLQYLNLLKKKHKFLLFENNAQRTPKQKQNTNRSNLRIYSFLFI